MLIAKLFSISLQVYQQNDSNLDASLDASLASLCSYSAILVGNLAKHGELYQNDLRLALPDGNFESVVNMIEPFATFYVQMNAGCDEGVNAATELSLLIEFLQDLL